MRLGRSGFTLLEVMLATAIGALLLFALYTAMDTHLRHVEVGRTAVEESVLARALLVRIGNDVTASLPAMVLPPSSSQGSQSSKTGASPSGQSSSSGSSLVGPTTVQFNHGLQGDANSLMLFTTRLPRELDPTAGTTTMTAPPVVSDLRRVTYWLAGGSSSPRGLARQEVKIATADDALATPPTESLDDPSLLIAEEVRSLEFRYFDGSAWQESWDGTATGSNGAPIGPPLAVEIKIGIAPPRGKSQSGMSATDVPEQLKYYRHVVAIPTANGPNTGQ